MRLLVPNTEIHYSSSVQRIVVTSSCASVLHVSPEPKVFSEVDWNEQSIKEVEEQGKDAPGIAKYRASKTLAEKGQINSAPCSSLSDYMRCP